MNGEVSTFMRNNGLNYRLNYGLDAVSVREIAARFQPNVDLAERLWSSNARECKFLATLLYPRNVFTPEKADTWLSGCFLPELMEQLCFNLLQHLDFAGEKALEWVKRENPETKAAGYTLLLRLLLGKKSVPDLSSAVTLAQADVGSACFHLQQSARRFLERVGWEDLSRHNVFHQIDAK